MALVVDGPLLLVGAGKMGGALLQAWLDEGLEPSAVSIIDPRPAEEIAELAAERGIPLNPETVDKPAVVVLAVKPQMLAEAAAQIAPVAEGALVVSILAGKPLAALSAALPGAAIVRAMPNTPAAVRRGITVAVAGPGVGEPEREDADALLRAAGDVAWIEDEGLIDAVTGVSGSGPAYVFLLVECLAAAGVAAGLPAELALHLARKTVEGSGELLAASPLPPETLRANVTSPAGTTAAALSVLMAGDGLEPLMRRAVAAATARARELAG